MRGTWPRPTVGNPRLGFAWLLGILIGAGTAAAQDSVVSRAPVATSPTVHQGWVRTGTWDAAEAVQAAAADKHRLYAINNTQVAVYDRQSGNRIAVSDGPAQHLNSGFLWEGRLYCAHSNFPRTPEHSMIKVLDPATMQMRIFKDFGASEGSLTWAIRDQGDWWCNFAFYGEQNHRTALVRFDDRWQQQGRWTYPARVVDQLGRYSLSGGVWLDGYLLVTGHDDPVVYRLRLPADGEQLDYVDQLPVPFTGQGIAIDPGTGGLIGIDRKHRQLIAAEVAEPAARPPAAAP